MNRLAALAALTAAVVLAVDQITKAVVRDRLGFGEHVELTPFFELRHVHNTGIAFGLFAGHADVLALIIAVVSAALVVLLMRSFGHRLAGVLATGAIAGGAAGNLVDRIARGHVTDFLNLPHWPAFNVADIAIVLGACTLVVLGWTTRDDDRAASAPRMPGEGES